MSIAFSRSIRSMNQDSFRPGLIGMSILMATLAAWMVWFFLARIPIYESSREFRVQQDGALSVTFPPDTLARILPGQKATLRLAATAGQAEQTLSAEVLRIPANRQGAVEIYLFSTVEALHQPGLSGEVRVEVEIVSPAVLALRSARQRLGDGNTHQ